MASANGIESWLTERVSAEDAEIAFSPTPDQLKETPQMPNRPFTFKNRGWEALKSHMTEGDELWYFCSPPETWQALHGRKGIALVRDGKVVETLVLLLN